MRLLWEKTEDGFRDVSMHDTDALHALQTDPERWFASKPAAIEERPTVVVEEPKSEQGDQA